MVRPDITRIIADARQTAIDESVRAESARDPFAKAAWEQRREYLDVLMREFRGSHPPADKTVFISYSVKSGQYVYECLKRVLDDAGYRVITGFHHDPSADNVLKQVLRRLNSCTFYVGILTPEIRIDTQASTERWAPSVWTMEEKGMALALGKSFLLMVHKRIHPDFWRRTAPEKLHLLFTRHDYKTVAEAVRERVVARHNELKLKVIAE